MANAVRCIGLRSALHSRFRFSTPIALPHSNADATAVKLSACHTGIRTAACFPNNSSTISPITPAPSEIQNQAFRTKAKPGSRFKNLLS